MSVESEDGNLIKEAFSELYDPERYSQFAFSITYSGKFSSYNANIKYSGNKYSFALAREWEDVSPDIKKGVLQYLMLKSFKKRFVPRTRSTLSVELYNNFIRTVSSYTKKSDVDPFLASLFSEINDQFFGGRMEVSNLIWGKRSIRTLGHYAYGSDTITMSSIFKDIAVDDDNLELLKYVLYHEMLHKKHKFYLSGTKNMHHTTAFRNDEQAYPNQKQIEVRLNEFVRSARRKNKQMERSQAAVVPRRGLLWWLS